MATAPKDGTLLRLLVSFEHHATEDGVGPQPTIGSNTWDNHHDFDEWQFAGWNWEQDCYTQGVGTPVGWLPMLDAAPGAALPAVGQEAGAVALECERCELSPAQHTRSHLCDNQSYTEAAHEPHDDALMKLSQFANTAAHMSESHMRNNLLSIADRLIALAAPGAAVAAREQEGDSWGATIQHLCSLPHAEFLEEAKKILKIGGPLASRTPSPAASGIPLEAGIAWQAGAFDTERKAVTVEGHAWYRHDHPKVAPSHQAVKTDAAPAVDAGEYVRMGWSACLRNVFSLCEQTSTESEAASKTEAGRQPIAEHFMRGRAFEAKGIAKAMNSFGPEHCDDLREVFAAVDAGEPEGKCCCGATTGICNCRVHVATPSQQAVKTGLPPPKTDDPIAWALFWLDSALRCAAFVWDGDQRDCAENALKAALATPPEAPAAEKEAVGLTDAARALMAGVVAMASEAHDHWDADRDMKVGKILLALAGSNPRYDKRSDALHAVLAQTVKQESGAA